MIDMDVPGILLLITGLTTAVTTIITVWKANRIEAKVGVVEVQTNSHLVRLESELLAVRQELKETLLVAATQAKSEALTVAKLTPAVVTS